MKKLQDNIIVVFVIKFCLLYGLLYGGNYIITGVVAPGGYYNAWVAQHLDYISAFRSMILHGASLFASMCGFESYVDKYCLHLPGVASVRMVYSCIGFDVLFFWWAFVLSFPQSVKRKAIYFFSGTAVIIVLNMIRVASLAMIRSVESLRHKHIDHHLIFNIIVYALIFLMITRMVNAIVKNKLKQ